MCEERNELKSELLKTAAEKRCFKCGNVLLPIDGKREYAHYYAQGLWECSDCVRAVIAMTDLLNRVKRV